MIDFSVLTREEQVRERARLLRVPEDVAEFITALELGEITGDVIAVDDDGNEIGVSEDDAFEQKHPRGKGGRFAKKGERGFPNISRLGTSPELQNVDTEFVAAIVKSVFKNLEDSGVYQVGALPIGDYTEGMVSDYTLNPEKIETDTWESDIIEACSYYVFQVLAYNLARVGFPPDDAANFVGSVISSWGKAANDSMRMSLALQASVGEIMGSKLSPWQQDKIENLRLEEYSDDVGEFDDVFDALTHSTYLVAETMYRWTQTVLGGAGIDTVTVYRGVSGEDKVSGVELGDTAIAAGNAIECWSVSPGLSDLFAAGWSTAGASADTPGIILKAEVPAEFVFCVPSTGVGSQHVWEVAIFGNIPGRPIKSTVVGIHRDGETSWLEN